MKYLCKEHLNNYNSLKKENKKFKELEERILKEEETLFYIVHDEGKGSLD